MVPSGHRPMEAVVIRVEAPDRVGYVEEGEGFLDVVIDHFSSERWDLELEVTTPEGERFTHTGDTAWPTGSADCAGCSRAGGRCPAWPSRCWCRPIAAT